MSDESIIVSFVVSFNVEAPFTVAQQPGDIVLVNHGHYGRKEGLVVGSHYDYAVNILSFLAHMTCIETGL